jgi:hypothetical protein
MRLQMIQVSRCIPILVRDDYRRGGRKASRVCRGRDHYVLSVHARGGQDRRPAADRCCGDDGDCVVSGNMPSDLLDDVVGEYEAERRARRAQRGAELLVAGVVHNRGVPRSRRGGHDVDADRVAGLAPRARRVEQHLARRQPLVPRWRTRM